MNKDVADIYKLFKLVDTMDKRIQNIYLDSVLRLYNEACDMRASNMPDKIKVNLYKAKNLYKSAQYMLKSF